MNLLKTFLGHSRYMNDEPFLKSTRNKFQSQLHHQKKKKKSTTNYTIYKYLILYNIPKKLKFSKFKTLSNNKYR